METSGLAWLGDDVAVVTDENESVEDEVVRDELVEDELLDDNVLDELSESPFARPSFSKAALISLPSGSLS